MGYDTSQTTETQLWIDNDESLHRRKWFCFANLAKKVRKGIFDAKKAEKLFRYLCDEAARRYKKEIGTPLAMEDRRQAEKDLVTDFLAHSRLDSFPADLEANIKPPMPPYVARREIAERRAHVAVYPGLREQDAVISAGPSGISEVGVRFLFIPDPRYSKDIIGTPVKITSSLAMPTLRDVLPDLVRKLSLPSLQPTASSHDRYGTGWALWDRDNKHVGDLYHVPPKDPLPGYRNPGAGKHDPAGHKPTMIVASPPPAQSIRAALRKRAASKGGK